MSMYFNVIFLQFLDCMMKHDYKTAEKLCKMSKYILVYINNTVAVIVNDSEHIYIHQMSPFAK